MIVLHFRSGIPSSALHSVSIVGREGKEAAFLATAAASGALPGRRQDVIVTQLPDQNRSVPGGPAFMILIGTDKGIYRWFEGCGWPIFHSLQDRAIVDLATPGGGVLAALDR